MKMVKHYKKNKHLNFLEKGERRKKNSNYDM